MTANSGPLLCNKKYELIPIMISATIRVDIDSVVRQAGLIVELLAKDHTKTHAT